MRILVLCNVPPGVVGGAEVQAWQLARQWAAAGHDVIIAGPENFPAREGRMTVLRLPLMRRTRATRAASYLAGALWLLWRRRREFDVVYCRFLREQAFAAALARATGIIRQPVVACPASTSSTGEAARLARSPVRGVWLFVFRRGLAAINAMSRRIEREMRELGLGEVPLSRIPNGVAMPLASRPVSRSDRRFDLLFVGRLVGEKALDVLLDAAARVRDSGRAFMLRVVGDGPLRARLADQLRRLSLEGHVELLGARPPASVAAEFAAADVFVLPSRIEGMPGVLLEAMACGLPVVATRVSGSEDVVDEAIGWLVDADDAAALARAIGEAIDLEPDRLAAMGARAQARAAMAYDIALTAARHLRLFSELTGELSADDAELGRPFVLHDTTAGAVEDKNRPWVTSDEEVR